MPKRQPKAADHLTVDGRQIPITNLQKVLYPGNGWTKAQVVDYYIRVAPYLLPYLRDRPVTLKRYPDGVRGEFFYEKDAPGFTPEWVKTFPVPRRGGGPDIRYILINDLPTLVWCANAASLELHPFLHQVPQISKPTSLVFDLDPGEGADVLACASVAFLLKDALSRLGLETFAKVSGSKGIQVYAPLNSAVTYDQTQPFARSLAEFFAQEHPTQIVAEMAKSERHGKVFVDWSQNSDFKTTVGVYSLRAKLHRPLVSCPVTWDELKAAVHKRKSGVLFFNPETTLKRLDSVGDLFAPVLTLQQSLPDFAMTQAEASTATTKRPKALGEYARKRDFSRTAEPAPRLPRASAQGSRRRFVVQKHAATHLHYDFRLEMHGVLKSWAVPKGLPYEQSQKRLAMATEDHPIEYLDFEGTIPPGQYGGGTVMVWDIGTYEVIEGNYYKGRLRIHLNGKKLKGEWELVRDRAAGEKRWSLVRADTSMRPVSGNRENTSAVTGKTMEQIAVGGRQWHSNRTSIAGLDLDGLPRSQMKFIEPMLAKPAQALPGGESWQYEIKLDGYRALAIKDHGNAHLLSRRNNSLRSKFPEIGKAIEGLEDGLILDGEIVALDAQGRPSFKLLQHYKENSRAIVFYVFDVIAWRGRDLRALPLHQRCAVLDEVFRSVNEPIRLSTVLDATPDDLINAVREQGLEGIIAKRRDSKYESGERSGNWAKYRVNKGQELVIGGYRPGKTYFDNLAVGYYNDSGKLKFIAKIKNGFTPELKRQVYHKFKGLETKTCPFQNLPEPKNARRGEALTAEAMKHYRWLKPKLVAEVEFTDWTAADHLRHSRFVGLREDKDPRDVHKES